MKEGKIKMGIEFNNEQIYAIYDGENWFHSATKDQVFEISGPAGSGKTTLILYFIERLGLDINEDVLFVAYMGKAANQMALNGLPAKTIHSAIYRYEKEYVRDEKGKIVFDKKGKPKLRKVFVKKEKLDKDYKLIVLDEGSMVNQQIGEDLESFGVPIVVLGDLNQLPPVFGKGRYLNHPNVVLTKIMRQAEGDPIVWLSQQVLAGNDLKVGIYGKSAVMNRQDIQPYHFQKTNIVITCTNRLRYNVNNYFRESIKKVGRLDYPHLGEKVVCRKNNWNKCIDNSFYLTNGTTGFVTNVERSSFDGKTMSIDMRPDFSDKIFKNIKFDYKHLYEIPGQEEQEREWSKYVDRIEFGYALTVHTTQGSQYQKVLFLAEQMMRDKEEQKKLLYTGITRAQTELNIAI